MKTIGILGFTLFGGLGGLCIGTTMGIRDMGKYMFVGPLYGSVCGGLVGVIVGALILT